MAKYQPLGLVNIWRFSINGGTPSYHPFLDGMFHHKLSILGYLLWEPNCKIISREDVSRHHWEDHPGGYQLLIYGLIYNIVWYKWIGCFGTIFMGKPEAPPICIIDHRKISCPVMSGVDVPNKSNPSWNYACHQRPSRRILPVGTISTGIMVSSLVIHDGNAEKMAI